MKKLLWLVTTLYVLSSCEKGLEVTEKPVLAVQLEQGATYHAGKPVKFLLSGKADLISMYSGEVYHDYTYKDARTVDTKAQDVLLQFRSAVDQGTQANQLKVLLSNNFNGNYSDINAIRNATWQDITNRFTLATGSAFVNSTVQSIKDLLQPGQPAYLAFRYSTRPQAVNGIARQWMIESLTLTSSAQLDNKNLTFEDIYSSGWQLVDENPVNAPARSSISKTRITMWGNRLAVPSDPGYDPSSLWNDPQTEHWIVSKPLRFDTIGLGPDRSLAVKGVIDNVPAAFEYTFTKPGTYQVVFVAYNATIKEQTQVTQSVQVVVEP